jgi:DNA-binding IclR family transcriptional regulator
MIECLTSHYMRHQYQYVDKSSGVGVVDKTVALIDAVAERPCSLADLVATTGLPRPTAHRLALALERHHVLDRDEQGRFVIGPRTTRWSIGSDALAVRAMQAVVALRDATGVSAQVYRRLGDQRLCVAAAEPASGLRDTVPVGSSLTLRAGSAAQVLVAWLPDAEQAQFLRGAAYSAHDLAEVRRRGWAHSVAQREPGVASISAPVRGPSGDVVAAVSISGPVERLARPTPAQRRFLITTADDLSVS